MRGATDAFGNALGNSIAENNWGGSQQESELPKFRRSEIASMNDDARIANVLASSGPGMSESDYWNNPGRTRADQYVDTFGGNAVNTGNRLRVTMGGPNGIDDSQVPSAAYRFVQDYAGQHPGASYDEVQQAYDGAWASQSDAHFRSQAQVTGMGSTQGPVFELPPVVITAPRMTSEEIAAFDAQNGSTGTIHALDPVKSFFTFTPTGRFLSGVGNGVSHAVSGLVQTGKQAVLTTGDAVAFGISRLDNAMGGNLRYTPQSALGQSLQQQGYGSTALNMIGGIVQGTVGTALGPMNALYRQDARMLGESLPGSNDGGPAGTGRYGK